MIIYLYTQINNLINMITINDNKMRELEQEQFNEVMELERQYELKYGKRPTLDEWIQYLESEQTN